MAALADAAALGAADSGLVVISTLRADLTIQSSVVNAGIMRHPLRDVEVVGFVTYGKVKLANLRERPQLTATFRAGWQWVAVEGEAEVVGRDGPIDAEGYRLLLREVFTAAGGTHDDWDTYDRVMAEQGRVAVFVEPKRVYSNG
jgi:PPOX class probable F420-dependent enzyme